MNKTTKLTMALLAVALLIFATGCPQSGTGTSGAGTSTANSGGTTQAMGKWTGNATDFSYTTFAGSAGKASDHAGRPLVVNFWAAW